MRNLIDKRATITSDNENYSDFMNKVLIITNADNTGIAYDQSYYPEMLCDFECEDGTDFPFALYEHEFKIIR